MPLLHFFKPKWQHPDPSIRRQAVEALAPEDNDTLIKIAREDEKPAIRRLALRRINDLTVIHAISLEDSDKGMREFALSWLSQLLAGTRPESPALAVRMAFLSRHPDPELLKFAAQNSPDPTLRRSAQDRISHEPVLRDIAINDTIVANRLAALERITHTSMLEAVYRKTRKSDKQVSREARTRLNVLREAEERPARIQAEAEQICARIESLGKGERWDQEHAELKRLQERWQTIADETGDAHQKRYTSAQQAFLTSYTAFCEARDAEQREWSNIRATRQALLAEIELRLSEISEPRTLQADTIAAHRSALKAWQTRWSEMPQLPVVQAQPMNEQFQSAVNNFDRRLNQLQKYRDIETPLQVLSDKLKQLLDRGKPIDENRFRALEKRWKALHCPTDADELDTARQRIETLLGQTRTRLRDQLDQREAEFKKLPELVDQLETLLKEKALKRAGPMHDRIQSSLSHLQALGMSRQRLTPFTRRLQAMTPQIRELQSWRKWGADEARERLCAEMESLVESSLEPRELASEIRRLRSEWNRLRSDGSATHKTLWKRFDKTAARAYEPCQAYFAQQAAERSSNLDAKRRLCDQLEAYVESADWSHMDWKDAFKTRQRFSNDWRRSGPVDRRESKEIAQRYHQVMETLTERLNDEHKRNLRHRNALIEQVRALLDNDDIQSAIDDCKRLQKQWHTTVPGKRKQENVIWQEFRDACDAVFARRRQQQDQRLKEQQQNKTEKQQLCAQMESLLSATTDQLTAAERSCHRIVAAWDEIAPAAKSDNAELERRFTSARHAFDRHCTELRENEQRAQLELLRDKATICGEMEQLLEVPDEAHARSLLQALDQRWKAAPLLNNPATEQLIKQRYARVQQAIMTGGEQRKQLTTQLSANLAMRQDLCLRMEILAGVESPPEAREARMQIQTSRLAGAIAKGAGDLVGTRAQIEHDWYTTGVAPHADDVLLQERFDTAREQCPWDRSQNG